MLRFRSQILVFKHGIFKLTFERFEKINRVWVAEEFFKNEKRKLLKAFSFVEKTNNKAFNLFIKTNLQNFKNV